MRQALPGCRSGAQLGGHQLGQLDGVEGRALAQVVPHDEELQAVAELRKIEAYS